MKHSLYYTVDTETCEFFYFLTLNESTLILVLIQIIMEVVSITSAAQAGLTSRIL